MNNTIIKPNKDAQFKDCPIKSDKWRNLYFRKCGKSSFGAKVFNTETEALTAYINWLKEGAQFHRTVEGIIYPHKEHSHCIQMPIK